jgi:hypothetical protein
MEQQLLAEIRSFIARTNMGPTYFGKAACNNSEIIARLERGGTVTLKTAERVRAFIAERSPEPAE